MRTSRTIMWAACMLIATSCAKKGPSPETLSAQAQQSTTAQFPDPSPPVATTAPHENAMSDSLPGMADTTPIEPGVATFPGTTNTAPLSPGVAPSPETAQLAPRAPEQQGGRAGGPMAQPSKTLTDGQILKVMSAVDSAEIEQARIVQNKSRNDHVKAFAADMISAHTRSKQSGDALERAQKIVLADSDLGRDLSKQAQKMAKRLKEAKAEEIDQVYAQGQVDQHQMVLDLLKNQFAPNATTKELKAHVEEARSMVGEHFEHAQELLRSLTRAAASLEKPPSSETHAAR